MRFPSINSKLLCFIFLLGFSVEGSYSSIEPLRKLAEFNDKVQQGAESRSKNNQYGTTKNFGKIFYPIGYGADPTGKIDSSVAIMNTIIDAFKVESSFELLPGVNDLGGVAIDLQGGNYIINQPIRLPGGGNVLIQGGTIRASKVFPGDRHLIELWAPTSSTSSKIEQPETIHPQSFSDMKAAHSTGIYYEDITFRDILFDSSLRGGGLYIADAARIRIDHCFFIRFTTQGIIVQKGHETFITSSFLGQRLTIGGDKGEKHFSGTAIDLASNDNAVSDVAIFSAATGVILRGQANILTGIHCYNKATFFGGVGILVKLAGLSQTRIDNCYMDYTAIVMEDPVQVHVTNGFFLGDANIVLKSIKGEISGLNIVDNMFSGTWNTIIKMEGKFTNINQVVVDRNNVDGGMVLKSTVGKLSVPGNGTKWVANFSKVLLFPNKINHVQYSMYIRGHQPGVFPLHAMTEVSNNAVTVESDKPVNGVVTVVVDQYNLPGEKNALL